MLAKATRAEAVKRHAREREKNLAQQRLDRERIRVERRERGWAKGCWYSLEDYRNDFTKQGLSCEGSDYRTTKFCDRI